MTNNDWVTPWAAGLFEGEGTIGINDNRILVGIQMTDLDVLEKLQENFGGYIYSMKKYQPHHKDSWKWQISTSKTAVAFLKEIWPYMGSRRQERILMAFTRSENSKRRQYERRQARALLLRGQGMTHAQIAHEVGVERSTISKMLKSNGA